LQEISGLGAEKKRQEDFFQNIKNPYLETPTTGDTATVFFD
jgi:hypothetical protein